MLLLSYLVILTSDGLVLYNLGRLLKKYEFIRDILMGSFWDCDVVGWDWFVIDNFMGQQIIFKIN